MYEMIFLYHQRVVGCRWQWWTLIWRESAICRRSVPRLPLVIPESNVQQPSMVIVSRPKLFWNLGNYMERNRCWTILLWISGQILRKKIWVEVWGLFRPGWLRWKVPNCIVCPIPWSPKCLEARDVWPTWRWCCNKSILQVRLLEGDMIVSLFVPLCRWYFWWYFNLP